MKKDKKSFPSFLASLNLSCTEESYLKQWLVDAMSQKALDVEQEKRGDIIKRNNNVIYVRFGA